LAGFNGVHYHLRHPPNPSPALALFGREGEQPSYPMKRKAHIGHSVIARLVRDYGVEVIPEPASQELRIIG
jgi:hypothetical protein